MTNPLDKGSTARIGNQGFANMSVGETRTVMMPTAWSEKGVPDLSSVVPYTMTRTNRPFIHDWVEAVSNPSLDRKGMRNVRWVVTDQGEPQLVPLREAARLAKLSK